MLVKLVLIYSRPQFFKSFYYELAKLKYYLYIIYLFLYNICYCCYFEKHFKQKLL